MSKVRVEVNGRTAYVSGAASDGERIRFGGWIGLVGRRLKSG